ncbi:MFS transporter [Enterovirga rhinocerotis]|uniref:MFS transporter n=1 Tax=Enterovirga rhinocerotis TaxID=1339210 RepID=A0A4R7BJL0_9HYPH|nr:MFS transporter [Enterovirga rhinocerotis]TDR85458.1 MFS transporter [Enterovirga rhinocerotis]
MTEAQRQIVFINAAHFITHYSLLILPTAVLVMARPGGEFGSEYGPIVALATAMFVLYGVGSLPQGWLAARFGRKALMVTFCIGTGLSLIAAGFATTPLLLAATLGSAGLFAAIYHPIGTAMLVESAGATPGRSIGINGVFGNIGVASAPIVTAFLAGAIGWRVAFFVPGIVSVLLGLLWIRVPEYDHTAHVAAKPFPVIPKPIVRRAVIVLLAVAIVSGLVFNAFTLLLPKLMQERLASDTTLLPIVGALAFFVTLCGAVTQFTVGRLIDRKTLKRVFVPLAVVLAPTLAALAFAEGWIAVTLAGIAAAVIFGQVTINETMTARYIAPPLRAKLYSIRFFVGFLGSAAAAPLVGILHERTGSLTAATLVLAAFAVITLLCALFFPDRREELEPELWQKLAPAE